MEDKLKRAFLLAGLVLYLFDLGSDIYVAVQYWKNYEPWWFGMTVIFISLPSLFVNGAAIIQIRNIGTFLVAIFQLSIVVRHIEVLTEPDKKSGAFSRTYLLAILRYIETIAESAPQWCLQVYIMLRQQSYPSYTVISTILSLLSLAWSITALEMERRKNLELDFSFINISLFLLWQLLTLVSRLFAIVLFAYVFRYYVFISLAVHWSILVGSIFYIQISAGGNLRESLLSSVLYAFPSLFHFAKTVLPMRRPALEMSVRYISLILTTIIMVTLSLAIQSDLPNMDVIQPIAITSVVVLPLSLFVYYCIHIRGADDDDDD